MKPFSLTIKQIAETIGAEVEGSGDVVITRVATLDNAAAGDLTFAVDKRREKDLATCKAAAVIVGTEATVPAGVIALRSTYPSEAVARLLELIADNEDLPAAGVHPTAVIDPTAQLGAGVAVGPHAVVGAEAVIGDNVVLAANVCVAAHVKIGEDSLLMPGVVVRYRSRIGRRCRIHPNAVIGADGFGYNYRDGVHHKVTHAGIVDIGDDVEIGACACIDRAKFGATRIGDGSKIDNLVQIAHNAQVGRGVLMAALVGVAGSAELGDFTVLGGHVGVRDNISVGPGVQVAAYSAVLRDVPGGQAVGGLNVVPIARHRRALALYGKIPDMYDLTRNLQKRLDALEQAAKDDRPNG